MVNNIQIEMKCFYRIKKMVIKIQMYLEVRVFITLAVYVY